MTHLLCCELTYFIRIKQQALLLFSLTIFTVISLFAGVSSHSALLLSAFEGIRYPAVQNGFDFPLIWFIYYIAPLFFLASYCERFIHHRLPCLLLQQFRRQTILFIHLLIQALFLCGYVLLCLGLLTLLSDRSLSLSLLGNIRLNQPFFIISLLFLSQVILLWLLQLLHLCLSLKLSPVLSFLILLVLLASTIKTNIFFNPFNFSMLSRWQDVTLSQISSWILLCCILVIGCVQLLLRQDFYIKEIKS